MNYKLYYLKSSLQKSKWVLKFSDGNNRYKYFQTENEARIFISNNCHLFHIA